MFVGCEHLGHHVGHEFLATKAWLDGHHEDEVHVFDVVVYGRRWRLGLQGNANLHALRLDLLDQPLYRPTLSRLLHIGRRLGNQRNTGIEKKECFRFQTSAGSSCDAQAPADKNYSG